MKRIFSTMEDMREISAEPRGGADSLDASNPVGKLYCGTLTEAREFGEAAPL